MIKYRDADPTLCPGIAFETARSVCLDKVYGASADELSAPYRIKRDNYT